MNLRPSLLAVAANLFFVSAALAAPELSVEQDSFFFGNISQGKKVQHSFVIKNTGDAPLQIKRLKASCGCTAATPSSSVIAPGKTGEIKVVFDSSNFFGRVQKTVALETNAAKSPNRNLQLDGFVIEEIEINPRSVSLGAVKVGTPRTVSVAVFNRGENALRLSTISTTNPQIKAKVRNGRINPGETGTIEITITPQTEAKVLSGYVHIATDNPLKKEITIPVYASPTK